MSQPATKPVSEPNIEEAFQRHSPIAAKVQAEYEKALIDVFADMEPNCLEPFAAILLENDNTILNKDTLIERVRLRMSQLLPKINENFFVSNDVGKKLITLEVLKDKFEPYKGTNWQVHKLTPEERTRPVRMRLMDSSIRFIHKQISTQEKAIEMAMAKSRENRERIQNIQNERVKLYALMQQQTSYYEEMEPKLMDLTKEIIGNRK